MKPISLAEYKQRKAGTPGTVPGVPAPSTQRILAKRDAQVDRLRAIDAELRERLDSLKEFAEHDLDSLDPELHRPDCERHRRG